jgi:hypothetical protein
VTYRFKGEGWLCTLDNFIVAREKNFTGVRTKKKVQKILAHDVILVIFFDNEFLPDYKIEKISFYIRVLKYEIKCLQTSDFS